MRRSTVLAVAITAALTSTTGAIAASKITSAQIKDGTITSRDIKNDTIHAADLAQSAIDAFQGSEGPAGAQGPVGPPGPTVLGRVTTWTMDFSIPGGGGFSTALSIRTITATCPAGQRVVSGGYATSSGVAYADKTYDGVSWSVGIDNFENSTSADGQVTALCAPAGVAVAATAGHAARDAQIARDVRRVRESK